MKKRAKHEPEQTRIISLDGSDLIKRGFTALKDGKLYPDAFRGVLDDSLDTLKMTEVFKQHKAGFRFRIWKEAFLPRRCQCLLPVCNQAV